MTANSSTLADLEAARRVNGQFGTQTHDESGIVDFVMPEGTHYVCIERDGEPDLYVGPFPDEDSALLAMNASSFIQGLCEENCLECMTLDEPTLPDGIEQIVIDMDVPYYTGKIDPEDVVDGLEEDKFLNVEVGDYKGLNGSRFAVEVWQVGHQITSREEGRDFELVVDFPGSFDGDSPDELGSCGAPKVGFRTHGFVVSREVDFEDLSIDHDVKGADQVKAIANALMAQRDRMVVEFKASFTQG